MLLLLSKDYRLHELKNKIKSLFKQYIVLIFIFEKRVKFLFISEF